jgi:hypothetical protein
MTSFILLAFWKIDGTRVWQYVKVEYWGSVIMRRKLD